MTSLSRSLGDDRPLWLAGHPVHRGDHVDVIEKYTRQVAGRVARASRGDVEAAIEAAHRARKMMRRWPAWRRRDALMHVSERLAELAEEFARVLVIEVGKPLRDACGEVERAVDTFRLAAEEATRIDGEFLPLDVTARGEGMSGIVRRVPIGPCSLITPFNYPLNLVAHKVAPALAAGCPFVLKPASATPVSALMIGELLAETDVPPDAFSILPCASADAAPLIDDDRMALLSFTGSAEIGWSLRARAARKRHVTLELGGNAACIVDAGVDTGHVAARIVAGAFAQAGQSCISVQRVLAHSTVIDRLREELVARTHALCIGDPMDRRTDIGPMITLDDALRLERWIKTAASRGARVLCGGRRMGALHEPTLIEGVPHDSELSCEEAFGPVATLEAFDDLDHAIRLANASRFGLQAGIFTNELRHAMRAFDELEVGGVIVGDVPSTRIDAMPYGGAKDSGVGREGVRYAIGEMTEPRLLVIRG
ncbi:MAG: aldehyde dehydrogenase family protein [Planctomycetota bacterium]